MSLRCKILAVLFALVTSHLAAGVSLIGQIGRLLRADAVTQIPTGSLVLLVADTDKVSHPGLVSPLGTLLSAGQSLGGTSGDLIVGIYSAGDLGSGIVGVDLGGTTLTYSGLLTAGTELWVLWFPSVSTRGSQVGGAVPYGAYRSGVVDIASGSDIAFVAPPDGTTVSLYAYTSSLGFGLATNPELSATAITRTVVTYSDWQATRFTAGELANSTISGPAADPDGDGLCNLLEYAANLGPKVPETNGQPVLGTGGSALTLTYIRRKDVSDLTYTVEVSNDLQTWNSGPSYTQEFSVTTLDTLRDQVVARDLTPTSSITRRFLRLRVDQTAGTTAHTLPVGAMRITFAPGLRYTGMPLVNPAVARDVVASNTGTVLTLGYAGRNLGALLTAGTPYYVELTGGSATTYVGDRFEVDVTATKASANNSITVVAGATGNTLSALPANSTLSGYALVVRPHVTLGQIFGTKSNPLMQGSTVLAKADQVQLLNRQTQAFETYYFLSNTSGSIMQWAKVGGGSTVQDGLAVPAGVGMIVVRNAATSTSMLWTGEVRMHGFAQPLVAGNNLVSQPLPIDASPVLRLMTYAHGMTGSTVLALADKIQIPTAGAIKTYYLMRNANGSIEQWALVGGGSTNYTASLLFTADGAAIVNKITANPHYYVPFYLTP